MIGTDIGGSVINELALEFATITAAAGNDNTAVTGRIIDTHALGQNYASGKLSVLWKANVNTSETLTAVEIKLLNSAASNMSGSATYGDTIVSTLMASGLVTDEYGHTEISFDLRGCLQYIQPSVKVNLSRSGTDTVLIGAVMTFGGAPQEPVS